MKGMNRYMKYLLVLFATLLCLSVAAQDTKVQEAKKAKLEREIAIIDKQLKENASKSSSMLADLELIRKKISNRKELVAESERQIKKYLSRSGEDKQVAGEGGCPDGELCPSCARRL